VMAVDPECRRTVDRARSVKALIAALPEVQPPRSFRLTAIPAGHSAPRRESRPGSPWAERGLQAGGALAGLGLAAALVFEFTGSADERSSVAANDSAELTSASGATAAAATSTAAATSAAQVQPLATEPAAPNAEQPGAGAQGSSAQPSPAATPAGSRSANAPPTAGAQKGSTELRDTTNAVGDIAPRVESGRAQPSSGGETSAGLRAIQASFATALLACAVGWLVVALRRREAA
jgi:hypothetical protein